MSFVGYFFNVTIKKHAKIISQTCETVELPVVAPNARGLSFQAPHVSKAYFHRNNVVLFSH